MGNLRPGDDVGFSNGLKSVDSMGITFPVSRSIMDYIPTLRRKSDSHDLHDLAKAALPYYFQEFEIFDFQSPLPILDKSNTNLE